jgi:beta-catenin-like protein 1
VFAYDTEYVTQVSKKHGANGAPPASEDTSHILGIVLNMFSNLASESPARVRLLAKFVENNYEKTDKLLEIRDNAQNRLAAVDAEINGKRVS